MVLKIGFGTPFDNIQDRKGIGRKQGTLKQWYEILHNK
jgi:hypothetical protein